MTALLRILERTRNVASYQQEEALKAGALESGAFCAGLTVAYDIAIDLLRDWLPLIESEALDAGRREERLADA